MEHLTCYTMGILIYWNVLKKGRLFNCGNFYKWIQWNKRLKCYFSYREKKKLVEAIRYVDLVIPENNWEQKVENIKEFKVDLFVMSDDWKGKFDYLKDYCEVVYLERTPEISTTTIKDALGLKAKVI